MTTSLSLRLDRRLFHIAVVTVLCLVDWRLSCKSCALAWCQENGRPRIVHGNHADSLVLSQRRQFASQILFGIASQTLLRRLPSHAAVSNITRPKLQILEDTDSYSALVYSPPESPSRSDPPPLIVVLHGAGRNDLDIVKDLADPTGEHAGLIPSLIQSGHAPLVLLENFADLAPYAYGQASFYNDPRSRLLKCIDSAKSKLSFDPQRIFLFGFSDGATVAVELMTTRRFAGAVICSYGYTGQSLPSQAKERLVGLPMWVFHSADDVIFSVGNSDRLVQQVQARYNRYEHDPENLPARVRGHSMGIVASKLPDVYEWMLQQPPIGSF